MSEELTLEEVNGFISGYVKTTNPGRILSAIFEAARAHLSRPVVGDEQMQKEVARAERILDVFDGTYEHVTAPEVFLSRALLAMSEQLAALQEENRQLKEAYGCHVQADAYSFGFPENEADYQYNKKQATWWRLLSRNCLPRDLDFECAELAKAVAKRSEIREEK